VLNALSLHGSFPLALAFLCASAASAALPIAPAGAATQAGAGSVILIASGMHASEALAFSVAAQALVIVTGAAVMLLIASWQVALRVRRTSSARTQPRSYDAGAVAGLAARDEVLLPHGRAPARAGERDERPDEHGSCAAADERVACERATLQHVPRGDDLRRDARAVQPARDPVLEDRTEPGDPRRDPDLPEGRIDARGQPASRGSTTLTAVDASGGLTRPIRCPR